MENLPRVIPVSTEMKKFIVNELQTYHGVIIKFKFPNGYGASAQNHHYTSGIELLMLDKNDCVVRNGPTIDKIMRSLNELTLEATLQLILKIKD